MYILFSILLSATLNAKSFETSYLKLSIPNNWKCQKIETIWSCVDPKQQVKEAFLVLTAKNAGPEDTLPNFQKSLSETRVIQASNGKTVQSKVNFIKKVNYRNHAWIQSLHLNSEILNYNTYYMSTVYDSLAITISLSLYNQTQGKYADTVKKVFNSIKLKEYSKQQQLADNNVAIATSVKNDSTTSFFSLKRLTSGDQSSYIYIIAAILALGIVVIFLMRRK